MADMKLFNMQTKDGAEVSDGPTLHLSHEHIRALKTDTPLTHGAEVELHGFGHVSDVSSHEDMDGNTVHSVTVKMHRMGMQGDGDKDSPAGDLRKELVERVDADDKRRGQTSAERREGKVGPINEKRPLTVR